MPMKFRYLDPLLYSGVNMGIHYFLYLLYDTDCGCPLKLPYSGGSNEHSQSIFLAKKGEKKNKTIFIMKIVYFYGHKSLSILQGVVT